VITKIVQGSEGGPTSEAGSRADAPGVIAVLRDDGLDKTREYGFEREV
jgi:hypothetical protein